MDVEVTNIRVINNAGPLKGIAEILLYKEITIREFKILQKPGDKAYIQMPATTWGTGSRRKYKTILEFASDRQWEVEAAILAAYQQQREKESKNEQGNKTRLS